MNKDNFEGGVRSAVGQGERFVGAATDDKTSEVKGAYNEVAGSAQSAWGSAKEAAKEMTDTGSIPDLSRLRDDIAKLTQTVSDLAQKQVASSRDQVATVVGAAGDSLSQSAAVAQDKFAAVEGDVEARIKKESVGGRRCCRLDRVVDWQNELSPVRPTLELLGELAEQTRALAQVELALVRAELSERSALVSSSLTKVGAGLVCLPIGFALFLVAVSLALRRFGIPASRF